VLTIALGALVLVIGAFSLGQRIILGTAVLVFLGYKIYREQQGFRFELVKNNLLSLFPGHLLLLLGLSTLKDFYADSSLLLGIWLAVLALTLGLDFLANALGGERWAVLTGLYCLIFGGIFYLIRELLVRSEKLPNQSELISLIVGIVGAIYLALAVYRFYRLRPAASS
jgi:dipeptide/tripeptide permease